MTAKNPTGPRVIPLRRKVVFSILTLLIFFGALEVLLAACGVRQWRLVSDPHVGFQPGSPLFIQDGDSWVTNPVKTAYFNRQSFPVKKGKDTFRIFCLGESTTFGHPYDFRVSYTNWLAERLRDSNPQRNWEVINCGGISYASYRLCVLMEELNQHQPDLYVVYVGQNEFLESRTYGDTLARSPAAALLNQSLGRSRTATLLSAFLKSPQPTHDDQQRTLLSGEVETILDRSVGPTDYHRDNEWRHDVVEHYRLSLERLCSMARSARAKIIFVMPASNFRDYSPFKSEHGDLTTSQMKAWDKAIRAARAARDNGDDSVAAEQYEIAARLDPEYAQGLWEAAHSLLKVGKDALAKQYFSDAVDQDVCPLRAITPIRRALADVTGSHGVPLIDFPGLLMRQHSAGPATVALGNEDFLDHVHPTIDGHQLLAWALFDQLVKWDIAKDQSSEAPVVERVKEKVMADIDSRAHAKALVQVIQILSWAGKNEEALKLTDRAEATHPGLSDVASYRGRLLEKLGREDEALQTLKEAVARNPTDSLALSRVGFMMLRAEKYVDARAYFATAILNTPVQAPARFRGNCRFGLGVAFYHLQQWKEAEIEFRAALDLMPDHQPSQEMLEEVLNRPRAPK